MPRLRGVFYTLFYCIYIMHNVFRSPGFSLRREAPVPAPAKPVKAVAPNPKKVRYLDGLVMGTVVGRIY